MTGYEYLLASSDDDDYDDYYYYTDDDYDAINMYLTDIYYPIYYLDDKIIPGWIDFLHKSEIIIDDDLFEWSSDARRPYYRMRGRRITEEQAFEIIRRTDTMLSSYLCLPYSIDSTNFNSWWFASNHYPSKYGWVHPNGIVGTNGITHKYPTTEEFIVEWLRYFYTFPYLDLVIAVTDWNEIPDAAWGSDFNIFECHEKGLFHDFYDRIDCGIWIHDGKIEFMNKKRTQEKYREYDRLYSEPDYRTYIPGYYETYQPDIVNLDYLRRCIAAYGLDPDEELAKLQPYRIGDLK